MNQNIIGQIASLFYHASLQLHGLGKYIIFYKCKFLNLSICAVTPKVADLLIHRSCIDYLCYENKTLKINGLLTSQILTEIILALTSSSKNALFLSCAGDSKSNNQKNHCAELWFMFSFNIFLMFCFLNGITVKCHLFWDCAPLLLAGRSWCVCVLHKYQKGRLGKKKEGKKTLF